MSKGVGISGVRAGGALAGARRGGMGRAGGVVLGLAALCGAGFAGWTLYRVAKAPAPATTTAPPPGEQPGMAGTQTVQALLASVQRFVQDQNWTAAERILNDAVRQYPADQDLRLAFGDYMMSRNRLPEAYEQYLTAIGLGPVPARVEFAAGTLANMNGQTEEAAAHYAAAMRTDPNTPEYPLYLASVQAKMNQVSQAKASLAIAGRLAPERAEIWGMLGQLLLQENKLDLALQQIEHARQLEPNEPAWALMEARVRKRTGDPERALDLLSAMPQSVLDDPATLEMLAECYGMLGRPGDAASRYIDAAERFPRDADIAFDAAQWLERTGERDEAVAWARKAVALGHPQAGRWIESLPQKPKADAEPAGPPDHP